MAVNGMADDKKSPKDTPHVIIEAEATTINGGANAGDGTGEGEGDTNKPEEKTPKNNPKKSKAKLKTFGRAIVSFFSKTFVAITFLLAVYAIFDNWQVKQDLAQVRHSVETLRLAGEEFSRQNLTTTDQASQESIARLLQAITGFGEQIDALNTRLFSMEAEIEGLQKPPATTLATPAIPTTPPAPVAPSNFSTNSPDITAKPSLLPLIQAARNGTSFDAVLADYLPHYPTTHTLTPWATTPPPSITSLWREYDGLLAQQTDTANTDTASSEDNTASWFGRLLALATTNIRLTPLGEASRFDALKKARDSQDLATAMLAVADYIAQTPAPSTSNDQWQAQWQAWLDQADQRLQLDATLTTLLNTNASRGGS